MSSRIAIIGAGIGGLAAAIALRRAGVEVEVYEQARKLGWVGTAITMTPNAMRVLDRLGVGEAIRAKGYQPPRRVNRAWKTGEVTATIELGAAAERKFGAPLVMAHRADLLGALASAVPADIVHFDRKLVELRESADRVEARFADGSAVAADALIGADGIHSTVRSLLFGPESPHFTGIAGFRALIPAARLPDFDLAPFTKWFGPTRESELLTTPINPARDLYVFATMAESEWRRESWSIMGHASELRPSFAEWPDEVQAMLDACGEMLKSALCDREPLPRWTRGRISLLGDACHPMAPFMAQGSAMALEDAALLSRALEGRRPAELPQGLQAYEVSRRERTARIQHSSAHNVWPKQPMDVEWVYGYDAWSVPLAA